MRKFHPRQRTKILDRKDVKNYLESFQKEFVLFILCIQKLHLLLFKKIAFQFIHFDDLSVLLNE